MPRSEHCIDWRKSAAEIEADYTRIAEASNRLLSALDALHAGCSKPGFHGWENGHGNQVGDEVEAAREELAKLVRPNAKPIGEASCSAQG